jgi:hypothetical protein
METQAAKRLFAGTLCGLALLVNPATAQQKAFSINLEYSLRQDQFVLNDPAGRLSLNTDPAYAEVNFGLLARWYATPKLHTEIGAVFTPVVGPTIAVQFASPIESQGFSSYHGSRPRFLIRQFYAPFSIGKPNRFELSAGVFGGLGVQNHRTSQLSTLRRDFTGSTSTQQFERISGEAVYRFPNATTFSAEAGLHLNLFLGRRWHIRYQGGWQWGLSPLLQTDITYTSSLNPLIVNRATALGRGSGLTNGLTVGYRFVHWKRGSGEE